MGHWTLLFLPPLLAYSSPWFGGVSFSAQYLVVPFAALLAKRFGVTGVIAIALGGLAFVVGISGSGWGSFGGSQIGRASCRERVEISVGAGSLKKTDYR